MSLIDQAKANGHGIADTIGEFFDHPARYAAWLAVMGFAAFVTTGPLSVLSVFLAVFGTAAKYNRPKKTKVE